MEQNNIIEHNLTTKYHNWILQEVAAAPTSVDRVKVIATTTQIVSMDYGAIMMDGGILIIAKPVCHILNMNVIMNSISKHNWSLYNEIHLHHYYSPSSKIGSETVNAAWGAWSEWSECSVSCGGDGTQDRSRSCVAPVKGGFPCSSLSGADSQTQSCNNGPCPGR